MIILYRQSSMLDLCDKVLGQNVQMVYNSSFKSANTLLYYPWIVDCILSIHGCSLPLHCNDLLPN